MNFFNKIRFISEGLTIEWAAILVLYIFFVCLGLGMLVGKIFGFIGGEIVGIIIFAILGFFSYIIIKGGNNGL